MRRSIGELKEIIMATEMKEAHWLGIELKVQESGSLCEAFILSRDYTECFFCFCIGC